jgi:molecular chaperone DnaJ
MNPWTVLYTVQGSASLEIGYVIWAGTVSSFNLQQTIRMSKLDPYKILEIDTTATQAEVKQAYRQLAKQFHPDSQHELANHEQITQVNAAYALLKDPKRRQVYDNNRSGIGGIATAVDPIRRQRAQESQDQYRQDRKLRREADLHFNDWIKRVYTPVNREMTKIMKPLRSEILALAADPFDDELMHTFQLYLEGCRGSLAKAQQLFRSMPNPANVAGIAAHLYYCLNHLEDGLEEFERFTQCYDDGYLTAGKEMFRMSTNLRREAQAALSELRAML